MIKPKPCKCKTENIELLLVFVFDYDEHLLTLRAVDRSEEVADRHLQAARYEAKLLGHRTKVWIEKNISDHLYGNSLYQFKGKR